ncbi:MAG: helix-hairpin-helix domain-containing protein, partial [Sporichthyaceae bacterium]|nr:helix-hairpin-helix domain-containing protein [Sporichthyaceae bacterium]
RGYDDGGLVDANTAPAAMLARLSALGPSLAAQVTVRDSAGGFSSAEEMAILTDLPPHVVDQVRDRLVFSPR